MSFNKSNRSCTSAMCMHVCTLTLLYLLVLVIAGWLLVGIWLYVARGRALWSVGAGYWTVLLAHVPATGTSLGRHKPAGQSGGRNREKESEQASGRKLHDT